MDELWLEETMDELWLEVDSILPGNISTGITNDNLVIPIDSDDEICSTSDVVTGTDNILDSPSHPNSGILCTSETDVVTGTDNILDSPTHPNSGILCTSETVACSENDKDSYDLVGVLATSENDAYEIYNDYAFKIGFSIRRSKQRHRVDNSLSMKRYVCSHAGLKKINTKDDKAFSKLDVRSNCPALVQFGVEKDGNWVVTKHVKEHNHKLCPSSSSHLLRSHRRISKNQVSYLKELKKSGVGVADGVRVLKNQSGGSPSLGFCLRDAYNALNNSKVLEGTDSNTLIQILKNRQLNEKDFFFDFELDSQSRLCNVFWRDGRMKQDYDLFGDLVVHDTTYRTNKYDMICGPFVGMNHHGMNVMFGCGLMNEKIESFEWLFSTFLRSMGNKHPTTIMTDQSAAMAAAISKIFPVSRHRLCIWHIGENSKKHIRSLRSKKGFMDLFNYVLKYCDTIAEFQHYWDMMTSTYQCETNKWLMKLYGIREKWCPAFSKDYFSGGILSSQRSESTNQAISSKLSKTSGLYDFYNCFVEVISEWRSKENNQDVRCIVGKPSMALSDAVLLLHAREIYTLKVYALFEEQFMKGSQCHQSVVSGDCSSISYHVWVQGVDKIKHTVCFGINDLSVSCTCKLFYEVGILCSHCLRIFNIHCVSAIPEIYILKRWRKDVVNGRELEDDVSSVNCSSTNYVASSLWRIQLSRKLHRILSASEENKMARLRCEQGIENIKDAVVREVGPIYFDECNDENSSTSGIVQNPQSSSLKNQRNKRPKSIVEKKFNQAQGRRKRANNVALQTKMAVQNLNDGENGYIVHPVSAVDTLEVVSPTTSSRFVPLSHTIS